MDFTGIAHRFSSPFAAAVEIKDKVYEMFGFTVNVGISTNRLLAKMASDFEKPNKIHTLFPEEVPAKMWPLPVSALYMAGKSSVEVLHKLGIRTIGELANTDPALLELHLKSHGRTLWELANGRSGDKVIREHVESKGIGHSTTLPKDLTSEEEAQKVLLMLAGMVAKRVRKEQKKAKMISVEIKYSTFQAVSHQKQLAKATSADLVFYEAACELFKELWNGAPIRLLGIRTSKLVDETEPEQMSIFDYQAENEDKHKKQEKQQKLDEALDQVRKKFGEKIITKGSLK
jgi:DNA polymerase-4